MSGSALLDVPLLDVQGVSRTFRLKRVGLLGARPRVQAVRDVSLTLHAGQTLGVVGESGSGKSTLGRCILRLIEPDRGRVSFRGRDVKALSARELRATRPQMSMVFQNPYSSLDPTWNVERIVGEPLAVQRLAAGGERRQRVAQVLDKVGLPPESMHKHPGEFSGGQRQRIAIARALVTNPAFVVCDEAVSSLDVSTRSQVLLLLHQLQVSSDLAYLFISHDLSVVRSVSDRVAVMYLGEVVEIGGCDDVLVRPAHPYTRALQAAVPTMSRTPVLAQDRKSAVLIGEPPSPLSPPSGCSFHVRCPAARPVCGRVAPRLTELADGRAAACHAVSGSAAGPLPDDLAAAHATYLKEAR